MARKVNDSSKARPQRKCCRGAGSAETYSLLLLAGASTSESVRLLAGTAAGPDVRVGTVSVLLLASSARARKVHDPGAPFIASQDGETWQAATTEDSKTNQHPNERMRCCSKSGL